MFILLLLIIYYIIVLLLFNNSCQNSNIFLESLFSVTLLHLVCHMTHVSVLFALQYNFRILLSHGISCKWNSGIWALSIRIGKTLKWRIMTAFYGFFICVLLDYSVYMILLLYDNVIKVMKNRMEKIHFSKFFFNILPYHPFIGFCLLFLDIFATVVWTLNGIFIIIVSFIVIRDFQIFSKKLSLKIHNKSKTYSIIHWNAYKNLCNHVHMTSDIIGKSILISLSINLYFICIKFLLILS